MLPVRTLQENSTVQELRPPMIHSKTTASAPTSDIPLKNNMGGLDLEKKALEHLHSIGSVLLGKLSSSHFCS